MRLFTTNGMDEKRMKGYTNPSKQDVLRYPSEFGRVFPTGRVYQYSQIFCKIFTFKCSQWVGICVSHCFFTPPRTVEQSF